MPWLRYDPDAADLQAEKPARRDQSDLQITNQDDEFVASDDILTLMTKRPA